MKSIIRKFLSCRSSSKSKVKKSYILWVTTEHKDGGYSSRWHGWSRELVFTYEEAVKEKAKIQSQFYDVEIRKV